MGETQNAVTTTQIKKRNGQVVTFDTSKIASAVWKAYKSATPDRDNAFDHEEQRGIAEAVAKLNLQSVEQIQDAVEIELMRRKLFDVAKAYIKYRHDRELVRNEKCKILNKTELDEVDKSFSPNSLNVLASRYLLRNEKGEIIETVKECFERVAIHAAMPEIMYDPRVFDKEGKVTTTYLVADFADFLNENRSIKCGKYTINRYSADALWTLWIRLVHEHQMKCSFSAVVDMLENNEFPEFTEKVDEFFNMMVNKDFMPNSPTLMNAGAPLGQLSACFVLGLQDTLPSIMKAATDSAMIFQSGGGIGINYSPLRPEGDIVHSTSGVASGPCSFMNIVNTVTEVVKQGGKRRGANMAILDYNHPDIERFVTMKKTPGVMENFNVSVGMWDNYWQQYWKDGKFQLQNGRTHVTAEEKEAKPFLQLIAACAWESAEPGLIFFDNINRYNPVEHALGPMRCTNPCFHPDTIIETVEGPKKIKDITSNTYVYCSTRDGELDIKLARPAHKTRENAETLKITMDNGKELVVTPEHMLLNHDLQWTTARSLHIGDNIVSLCRARRGARYSGIKLSTEGNREYRMEHRFIYEELYGRIPNEIDIHHKNGNTYDNALPNLEAVNHYDHARLTAHTQPNNHQVKGYHGQFIESGKHGQKTIVEMPESLKSNHSGIPRVVKIEEGPITDVYDIYVEDNHNLIANGIVAHNCGEVPLYDYEPCNLGSINLANFIDKRGDFRISHFTEVLALAYEFLDNIIDVNKYPLREIEEKSLSLRRIGIGVMGLADMLSKMKIAYNSSGAYENVKTLGGIIAVQCMANSAARAKERGSFRHFDVDEYIRNIPVTAWHDGQREDEFIEFIRNNGMRNVFQTTIAPTGSISMIADTSNGIEPHFALTYKKEVAVGEFYYINKPFEEALNRAGVKYTDELKKQVADNYGSCQGIKEIPEEIQKSFRTTMDIHWMDHVVMQAVWQKWINNAISKTINMPEDATVKDVESAYLLAHELGCKGITVYRDNSRSKQVLTVEGKRKKTNLKESIDAINYIQMELHRNNSPLKDSYGVSVSDGVGGTIPIEQIDDTEFHDCPGVLGPPLEDSCCRSPNVAVTGGCETCLSCGFSLCHVA